MWHVWERREMCTVVFVETAEGKRDNFEGLPIEGEGDNIKTGLKEVGREGKDWRNLALYRVKWRAVVNTFMNLRVP
jgi:hypothetical protein